MENMLFNPNVKEDAAKLVRHSEVGGLAGVRSIEKILDGTTKEMVIAEESYNGMGVELTDEMRKNGEDNMNI